ncbi:MAG: amidophosphoribosyltransferase, partial [Armatimonadota bacterium]|nr:amidophosphoribosyltransferase [Armatimonadota bacterium]
MDKPQHECGVIGIYAPNEDVARMAFFGLYALQHRGQEAAGIAVADGQTIRLHKDVGMVAQVFTPQNLAPLAG